MASLGKLLLVIGGVLFVGAVGWWYAFFSQFLHEHVKEASKCFYSMQHGWCHAHEMLELVSTVPPYSPLALYISAGVGLAGLLLLGVAPPPVRS